jgi:hypothetical protein
MDVVELFCKLFMIASVEVLVALLPEVVGVRSDAALLLALAISSRR